MNPVLSLKEMTSLQKNIESILANPDLLLETSYQHAVFQVLRCLEKGTLRVSSPANLQANCGVVEMKDLKNWIVHEWVKESILLAMKLRQAKTVRLAVTANLNNNTQERVHMGELCYHDKFDLQGSFAEHNVRALPGALAREGSYIAPHTVLMPSFVNIGAWVGENTMVDTWATIGSCAQIGKNVHIAGGVGIGGVLEPVNAHPVLIGDHAFIGSRAIIVEGVTVGENAVIGANCSLTASTPVYDVTGAEKIEYRGMVPAYAVVVPGTRMREFPGGDVPLSCCYIIDYRNKKQNEKLGLNAALRTPPKQSDHTETIHS